MRYNLSEDELFYYQEQKEKAQEPAKKAVEVIEAGINAILAELGVDLDKPIPQQQANLGIIIQENTCELTPQLNGFFIFQVRDGSIAPITWIGDARLDNTGKAWITVERFDRDTRRDTGGIKVF